MPGILPMKVIKVGSSAQSRVAQACDRCRSKKIRCDGIRPCCSQCANVGFECKTSDKLSRRAFPRGYTETLEERVRSLETEVRELKDLLDEKDEKIDVLSKIHSQSNSQNPQNPQSSQNRQMPPPQQPSRPTSTSQGASVSPGEPSSPSKAVTLHVQELPFVPGDADSEPHVVGASTGEPLIDAFKTKAQEKGKQCPNLRCESFFRRAEDVSSATVPSSETSPASLTPPPRLVSDQLVNIYFQEWAPLFPILHSPTFLSSYEKYMTKPEDVKDERFLAQLHLILGIASFSSGHEQNKHDMLQYEVRWRTAIDSIVKESSLAALQCLALAQLYCISKGDYSRLVSYKSLSFGMSLYLGLQQSQRSLPMNALNTETRKRVFWTLYTLDCFSAALLGLPKMIRDSDVQAEYPADIDDEFLSEHGFHPSEPDESTKISSALALFKASRIMSKVLEKLYSSAATSHEVYPRDLRALEEELETWSKGLASHLKLKFVQDKPSTHIISSRCPIMSMVYYYIRSLIHRPVVFSAVGAQLASSTLALAESSKRMIQIIQLLEERRLSFSICLNKSDLLVLAGFGLLYRNLELNQERKLVKDSQTLLLSVAGILERDGALCANDFRRAACSVMSNAKLDAFKSRSYSDSNVGQSKPGRTSPSSPDRVHALAARLSRSSGTKAAAKQEEKNRRLTMPDINVADLSQHIPTSSRHSVSSARRDSTSTQPDLLNAWNDTPPRSMSFPNQINLNLDYLPLDLESAKSGSGIQRPQQQQPQQQQQQPLAAARNTKSESMSPDEWERMLSSIDNGPTNIYDNIYGGRPVSALADITSGSSRSETVEWSPGHWNINGGSLHGAPEQSVLSFSEESLTSGDDFSGGEFSAPQQPPASLGTYQGIAIPEGFTGEHFNLDLFDNNISAV